MLSALRKTSTIHAHISLRSASYISSPVMFSSFSLISAASWQLPCAGYAGWLCEIHAVPCTKELGARVNGRWAVRQAHFFFSFSQNMRCQLICRFEECISRVITSLVMPSNLTPYPWCCDELTLTKSVRSTNKCFKILLMLRSFKAFKSICPSTNFGLRVEMLLGLSDEAIISGLYAILIFFKAQSMLA